MFSLNHKRLKMALLVFGIMLALAGCSSNKETSASKENSAADSQVAGSQSSDNAAESAGGITDAPQYAPEFALKDLEGNTVSLSDYKGSYVFINFWATWCQYCDKEMPDLVAFQKKHAGEVTVIAVNVNEDPKTVQAYLDKKKIDLKVVLDADGSVAEEYLVSAYPTTFLIDKTGKVIGYVPGMLTAEDMESTFKYLQDNGTQE